MQTFSENLRASCDQPDMCLLLKLREAKADEPLLVNERGQSYTRTSLSELVRRLARKAGITRLTVRAHVLRHLVATLRRQPAPTCRPSRPCSITPTFTRFISRSIATTRWTKLASACVPCSGQMSARNSLPLRNANS